MAVDVMRSLDEEKQRIQEGAYNCIRYVMELWWSKVVKSFKSEEKNRLCLIESQSSF